MRNKKNDVVVFDPKIAKDLIFRGYRVMNIAPDKKIKNGTVFYFRDTSEIRDYLIDIWDFNFKDTTQ